MKRTAIPFAIAAVLAASPALAQNTPYTNTPYTQDQLSLAPVEDVLTAVQQRLGQRGYDVAATGEFDAATRNGVLRFQSDSGLRPTGNVDLSTIAALGINVDPSGQMAQTAMAPTEPPRGIVDDDSVDYPLLKDEHMSAPQTGLDEGDSFENVSGVPQPEEVIQLGEIPGLPPGFPEENLVD